MIRLTVVQSTFEKYLYSMGFNYKIKQYEDFIATIQRIVFNKITNSTDLQRDLQIIFSRIPSANIFFSPQNIEVVYNGYLHDLIEHGELDLYLEEKNYSFSNNQMKMAYYLKLAELQDNTAINNFIDRQKVKKDINTIKAFSCFKQESIDLSYEDIEEVKLYFYRNIFKLFSEELDNFIVFDNDGIKFSLSYSEFLEYFSMLNNSITQVCEEAIFKFLSDNDFIFSDKNNVFDVVYSNEIYSLIKGLTDYFDKRSILSTLNYVVNNEELSFKDIYDSLYLMKTNLNNYDQNKISSLILRLSKIRRKDIVDVKVLFSNDKNEIETNLIELLGETL